MFAQLRQWPFLCSFSLVFAACASDAEPGDAVDAGLSNDSGMAVDAGTGGDTGVRDSGVISGVDAGTLPDAGAGDAGMCVDLTVFADRDMDGYGESTMTTDACLVPGQELPGYSRRAGDCNPEDPWSNPGATEICNDHFDDNCDNNSSETCPTTQTAGVNVPNWDCSGTPPNNVYAWAVFTDGQGYYQNGGCFVFFEGLRDEFYVKHNLARVSQAASCEQINGCVCPSLNNWPSYDRRLYAFTLAGNDPAACEEIVIQDNGNMAQAVSNGCRKYLYQLHYYDIPYSYLAGSLAEIQRRIQLFPTLEVSCVRDAPHANLPYQNLLSTSIQLNPGFVKL